VIGHIRVSAIKALHAPARHNFLHRVVSLLRGANYRLRLLTATAGARWPIGQIDHRPRADKKYVPHWRNPY